MAPTRRELKRQIAERDRIIKDLTQSQKRFEVRDYSERVEAQGGEPFEIPRGAIVISEEDGTFELPPIIEEFPGGDWDDMDWDDYYDDVGDEDADSYGEDAAK